MEIRAFTLADEEAVLDFYERIGYAKDDVVSLGKRLIQDA